MQKTGCRLRGSYFCSTVMVSVLSTAFYMQADAQENKTKLPKDSVKYDLNEVNINSNKQGRGTLKLNAPLKQIPITFNSVGKTLLDDQGVDDFQSALKNVSGVNPVETYGGFQQFVIRGFTDFLMLVDGFRDERQNISQSAPMSSTASVDHIEVVKGPASVLFGHSALGGIINVIRKQPTTTPTYDFSLAYGSYNTRRMTAGAGGAITDKLSYRADFGISDQDGWRKAGFSKANGYLALNYALTAKDQFQFQIGGAKDDYQLDAGIPTINGVIPAGVAFSTRYNTPQDRMKYSRTDYQLRYNHSFSADTKLTETIAYATDNYHYFSSETLYLNAAQDSVNREFFYFNTILKPLQNTLELSSVLKTGSIEQRFTFGNSLNYLNWKQFRDSSLPGTTTVGLINPVETQPAIVLHNDTKRRVNEFSTSFYLQDWINFTAQLKALIGLRYDYFKGEYRTDKLNSANDYVKGVATDRESDAFTYRFGLVYEPVTALSIYGSYANYFKPGRQLPVNDIVLKPEKGAMSELGVKLQINEQLSSTTSIYHIKKTDIIIGRGAGVFEQAGKAVSKGVEEDLTYTPNAHLSVTAGYSYTDARFKDYVQSPTVNLAGKRLFYAPDHQANLWATYRFARNIEDNGFRISAGGNFLGSSFADNDNAVKLPAYTIINAAVHYQFKHVDIGLNVNNVFNKREYFVSAINDNQLYPGKPANYLASVRYKF
ncbi:TonB-dependent receptor [Pedobacter sp. MC2016-15]|uniref:TonB-dependent receptor n=1 Tax=Pedobacter sp. MC2016-15 TaxID=2994473 RepID=UPI002245A883|nr:TonB-dependent receptor [Pedobacter sp. MC2016-15]MCX2478233.1 TonB-dependent receptor [Pedobacter sp. MC2016-15]